VIARQFLNSLFPRPRGRVSWTDALPLVIFLIVFAGGCLWLELSDKLMFLRPWAFALIVVAPWVWWMAVAGYAGLSKSRSLVSMLIRLCLVGLFVVLIAEPRAVRTRDVLSVVYCVDISDSVDKSTDRSLEFVAETVKEKLEDDEAGLVVFGRNSAVELPPRISFPFEGVLNSRIERDATNLQQSLSLAAAMLPEENRGRIVLVSDGTETVGSLREILDDLKAREIAVDVLGIGYDYKDEVLLERLDLPPFVKMGESYEATIVLTSLKDGAGQLVVKENGETIYDEPVAYKAGKRKIEIPIQLREPGYYEYKARITVPDGKDNLALNNEVQNFLFVEGEGKVLLVHEPGGDERDYEQLVAAIRAGDRLVETREGYDFPRDALSLMPYDAVLFVNVGNDIFDAIQLNALKDAVYNMGIGFMMVGGPNSFGPGGYHRTVVEEALPVSMDITKKKILPKGALVIILHTCEFPEGNTWAKRITKQAVKVLGAQDEVGAIDYDYQKGEQWIFELTPARDYDKLVKKINGAEPGDMPSFTATMQLGLTGLEKSDAASRHMIIISDGDPPPPPPNLLKKFKDAQISVSTVAIFPHGGRDVTTLRAIATVTGGRYYFPDDPAQLPSIFIKEAKTLKRSMIQNKTIIPEMEFPDPIMEGISEFPPVHGYVLTSPKEGTRGKTILKVPPEEDGDVDPILAIGRYGLGVTAAFTADLGSNWGKDLVDGNWPQFEPFIKQLMTRISRVRKEGHLRMWTYTNGNEGVIIIEDYHPEDSFLDVNARVAGPRDRVENISVKQIGPRRYQATVPLWGRGRYQLMVNGKAGERTDNVQGGFIVPYSPEYLQFRENHIALTEIAERTGGEMLTAKDAGKTIYGRRSPKKSSWPVFDWFLVALACLIPLDVGLRRVQIDWNVIKGWFSFKSATESTQTMGALLDRKKSVASTFQSKKETPLSPGQVRPISRPGAGITPTASIAAKTREVTPKQAAPVDDGSTTSRLLALKRKRSHDDGDNE
jgi:uncharacterized membrane protein